MALNRRVSVVMPTRDRAQRLTAAVECVLAQSVDLELVVVDDGSTDGTAATVANFADARIRYIRQEGQGLCAARNAGLRAARHSWVAFVDDDDLWAPTKLALQLDALAGSGRAPHWCIASTLIADEALNPVMLQRAPRPEDVAGRLRVENCVPGGGSGVLADTGRLRSLGGFDVSLRHLGDWELWLRLAAVGPPAVVAEPQLVYRRHGGQMSVDLGGIAAEVDVLVARGLVDPGTPASRAGASRPVSPPPSASTARLLGRALLARQAVGRDQDTVGAADQLVAAVRRVTGG